MAWFGGMGGQRSQERASTQSALVSESVGGLGEGSLVESRLPFVVGVLTAGVVVADVVPMAPGVLPAAAADVGDVVCIVLRDGWFGKDVATVQP
jgi:hypothetical protein